MRERVRAIILSATQESSRRMVTESIAATLNSNQLTKGAVVDDFATRIKLTNGSEIISLPPVRNRFAASARAINCL